IVATAVVFIAALYMSRSSSQQSEADASIAASQSAPTSPDERAPVAVPVVPDATATPPPAVTSRAAAPAIERKQEPARVAPLPSPPRMAVSPPLAAETLPAPAPSPVPPAPAAAVPQPETPKPTSSPAPAASIPQAAATPSPEDDDAGIRRAIASYARAI